MSIVLLYKRDYYPAPGEAGLHPTRRRAAPPGAGGRAGGGGPHPVLRGAGAGGRRAAAGGGDRSPTTRTGRCGRSGAQGVAFPGGLLGAGAIPAAAGAGFSCVRLPVPPGLTRPGRCGS